MTSLRETKMDAEMSASFKPDPVLQSLVDLTSGATLLKAGRSVRTLLTSQMSDDVLSQGRPHFRRFRLTSDLTRLIWESSKKTDAAVLVSEISEIKLGQKTQNFKRNPLPEFESRSFSLIYGGRSLDIVCKDRKEFQTWTTGLKVCCSCSPLATPSPSIPPLPPSLPPSLPGCRL